MASYISSNANRFYTALESAYGQVGAITATNRIPAVKLAVKQQREGADRKDKTGSRTFAGMPAGGRRKTAFDLKTYLASWDKGATTAPSYAPLFQAAMGGTPAVYAGGTAGAGSSGQTLVTSAPHGLEAGQAVTYSGEIRFVAAIPSANSVVLNAPFTTMPADGASLGRTVTMQLATELGSATIFDYWSPATAVQRVLCGAAVDKLEIQVNGDFHEVNFSGIAQDLIDDSSFAGQVGGLQSFPAEPELAALDYSVIPGHMGQAWLGTMPGRFYTLTSAKVTLDNQLDVRTREFGSEYARAISPGRRKVSAAFEMFSLDDEATKGLYQAARQQSPIEVMLQLGEIEGQLTGLYLKSVVPEVPEFNDSENRLQWKFRDSRAQGTSDDELTIAFA